ncbi:MAG: ABC transporter substrate-binding protein [Oligoflexales bacterium]
MKLNLIFQNLFYLSTLFAGTQSWSKPITLAWESFPRSVDPRFALDANSQYISELLHCQLISFDQNGQILLDLAQSTTWKKETVLEVQLKSDIKFRDHTKVTTKDVAATYNYFLQKDLKHPSPRSVAFQNLESLKVLSENIIQFHLKQPDASFINNLVIGVLPHSAVKDTVLTLDSTPSNCGPFQPSDHGSHHISLASNPQYTLAPPAKSSITIKIVQDETTRYAKLKAGELDLVQNLISREKLEEFSKDENFKLIKKTGLRTSYIGFNMKDRVLKHPEVRKAIDLAINRDAIIKHLLKGYATPAKTMLLPHDPFSNSQIPKTQHQFTKAKKLIQSLTKKPLRLKLTTTTDRTRMLVAKAIQQDLRKIGIQLDVQSLEWGRFKQEVENGHIQMWMLEWVGFKDPDILRYAFSSDFTPPNGGNRGWFKNKEFDTLSSLAQQTTDFSKRKEYYTRMQNIIHKEKPYIYLWHEDMVAVHRTNLHHFKLYADGRLRSMSHTTLQQ